MDKTEQNSLNHIPMQSLSLRLARPTIRMQHGSRWRIDKVNPVHDLLICMTGGGDYEIGEIRQPVRMRAGDAMLIPAYTRFRGRHAGGAEPFTGIAQHFSLDLFGRGDVVDQMSLKTKVTLSDWDVHGPLVRHYHGLRAHGPMTLQHHHQFMVLLLAYLEDAFVGWKSAEAAPSRRDPLSMHIMMLAARLAADPLGAGMEDMHAELPYNPDYFRRAFRNRIGQTPQKYRDLKRMEFAADRLGQGMTVKAVAAELGYSDPYFFSRKFKSHMGASPSNFREKPKPDDAIA